MTDKKLEPPMNTDETWVFFVPPGWILGGTIAGVTECGRYLILRDAVYLDAVAEGQSMIGGIAGARTPADLMRVCTRYWPLPDGYLVQIAAVLHAGRCQRDLSPMARKDAADAIKNSR